MVSFYHFPREGVDDAEPKEKDKLEPSYKISIFLYKKNRIPSHQIHGLFVVGRAAKTA
jgi:hypothetical protein